MKRQFLIALTLTAFVILSPLSADTKDFSQATLDGLTAREGVDLLAEYVAADHVFTDSEVALLDVLLAKARAENAPALETQVEMYKLTLSRRTELAARTAKDFSEALKLEKAAADRRFVKKFYQAGAGTALFLTASSFTGAMLFGSMSASARMKQLESTPGSAAYNRNQDDWKRYELLGYGFTGGTLLFGLMLYLFEGSN